MVAAAIRRVVRAAGFELTRYAPRNFTHLRRRELLASGAITVLVDVGAADGGWAQAARNAGFRGRIVSFEPRSDAYVELARRADADGMWTAHRLALSDAAGEATLHLAGQASSLWPEGEQVAYDPSTAFAGEETVPVARLDDLGVLGDSDRAYVKVDVQGHELAVLEGAPGALVQAAAVELELSFAPLYAGQPLAHDLLGALDQRGFRLASLEVSWRDRTTGDLLLANGIFLPLSAAR